MAQYATVNWQPGDEVTSLRLEQMAQNEEWLHDNALIGVINYQPSALGQPPSGRAPGLKVAKRVCAVRIDFDSQVPVSVHIVRIDLTNLGFTEAPVVAISYNVENNFCVAHHAIGDRNDYCEIFFSQRDALIVQIKGTLDLILVGA